MYVKIDRYILEMLRIYKVVDSIVHMVIDPISAILIDLYESVINNNRKTMFIAISNGTIDTDSDANCTPLLQAIKIYAIMIVDGKVPRIPPVLVPYFSAIIVIIITTNADNMNGKIV